MMNIEDKSYELQEFEPFVKAVKWHHEKGIALEGEAIAELMNQLIVNFHVYASPSAIKMNAREIINNL